MLATAGRSEEAAAALEQALERYERKKNLAMVAQVRPKLEALRDGKAGLRPRRSAQLSPAQLRAIARTPREKHRTLR